MSILIKGMEMPKNCWMCPFFEAVSCEEDSKDYRCTRTGLYVFPKEKSVYCPLIEVPPHGDLIDRDALIKDGWSNLYKEVMRMGGYAIHELPLKNPTIPVVIEREND